MDAIQTGIVALLKSAIIEREIPLPEHFDIDAAYPIIQKHHMTSLAYAGALNCGIDSQRTAMKQLFQSYLRAVQLSQRQMKALKRVVAAFEEAGIDYLPLKGCVMKALYPQPEYRLMGDADVLIRQEQYDRIVPVMKALGFAEEKGEEWHYVWTTEHLNLELHKYLLGSEIKKAHGYFQSGWGHAQVQAGMRYAMDEANTFAFLLAHFAKHCISAGIGCRHVVDLWVYLRNHPQMDQAHLRAILETMNLWTFYQNIRKLIGVWFEEETPDEKTEFISQMIFSNGSWGHDSDLILNKGIRDMGKTGSVAMSRIKYVLSRLFPSVQRLKNEYPILRERPWLLPVLWIRRLFEKLIRANPHRHMKRLRLLNENEINERKAMLEYVGLREDE